MKIPSAFSIGKSTRTNEQKKNLNPGPGTHTINPNHKSTKTPSWGFGRQKKFPLKEKLTPGPGSYEITHKPNNNKFSLRKKDKVTSYTIYDNPGPEKYCQSNQFKFKANPHFSFGAKQATDKMFQSNANPGVGNYNLSKAIPQSGPKIGKQKRGTLISDPSNKHPGPAQFNTSRPISAGPMYRFTRKGLNPVNNDKTTPGPGKYNIKSAFDDHHKAKTVGQRTGDKNCITEHDQTPGPGAYDPQILHKNTPGYKIGTGQRQVADKRAKIGPGHYEYYQSNRPKSASYRMGLDLRRPLYQVKNTPGPGNYLKTDFINTGCQIGIHGKKEGLKIKMDDYPGPGEYTLSHKHTNKHNHTSLIGTSLRQIGQQSPSHHLYPGPGHYNHQASHPTGHKTVIGKQTRILHNVQQTPGPGNYDIHNTVGECNKYSMDPDNLRSLRFNQQVNKSKLIDKSEISS